MNRNFHRWFFLFLGLCAIFSVASLFFRFRVEERNKAVGLCYEMQVLKDLAAASHQPILKVLQNAKFHGLTGVTLSEETLDDLLRADVIQFKGEKKIAGKLSALKRVQFGIKAKFGIASSAIKNIDSSTGTLLLPNLDWRTLKGISLGLNPEESRVVSTKGLILIARHANPLGCTPEYIYQMLKQSKELGATFYLPEGDQVLGQRKLIADTAMILKDLKLNYASPEFARLAGDASLSKRIPDQLVRLHSALAAEIERMSPEAAQERYLRAFRERNIRLLLMRPFTFAAYDPAESLYHTLGFMKSRIEHYGGQVAPPHPFKNPDVPSVLFIALGISIAAFLSVLYTSFLKNQKMKIATGIILLFLGLACIRPEARTFMAFLAAVSFPFAAYWWMNLRSHFSVFSSYIGVSLISLTGGLCAAGLLNELPYLVDIQRFPGVKASLIFPLILIAGLLFLRKFDLRQALKSPIKWGSALTGFIFLALVFLMVARSGNDNPAAVSSFELKIRSFLDTLLYVRPRTKEFLFGHPALWLGLSLWTISKVQSKPELSKKIELCGMLFLFLGAIGQTSIVNTFCHLHTPLLLSLIRVGEGLVIGGVLGALLALFIPKVIASVHS